MLVVHAMSGMAVSVHCKQPHLPAHSLGSVLLVLLAESCSLWERCDIDYTGAGHVVSVAWCRNQHFAVHVQSMPM
jgi:hypothetical protein